MSALLSPSLAANPSSQATGETRALAGFIAGLRAEQIPASVVKILGDALVDGVGCGLYGMTTPWAQIGASTAVA